jgi:hypothetical protein
MLEYLVGLGLDINALDDADTIPKYGRARHWRTLRGGDAWMKPDGCWREVQILTRHQLMGCRQDVLRRDCRLTMRLQSCFELLEHWADHRRGRYGNIDSN